MIKESVYTTELSGLLYRGKVRDTYELDENILHMVATDRISAFDVIMPQPVPGKGVILTKMALFWFKYLEHLVCNHLIEIQEQCDLNLNEKLNQIPDNYRSRGMIVKRAERIDMECVVRGHIAGSAWAEYSKKGTINGSPYPKGIKQAEKFAQPVFTPSTKAESGHDEPLSRKEGENLIGKDLYQTLEDKSIELYSAAYEHAEQKGMIIADTKFEFGFINNEITLIDEVLTPDSSRFWDVGEWNIGTNPPAYDKQYLRDWLIDSGWNREPPAPNLPTSVLSQTFERYHESYKRLTGDTLGI